MSNPENVLAKYRSYSYHHILIACDNEAAARYIREANQLSVFRELGIARGVTISEEDKVVSIDTVNEAEGQRDAVEVGKYVVLINGMIDTTFVIKEAEWFTTTAASADKHDRFTSIAVEGRMVVEEPRGIQFLNALNTASDLLESDPTGIIYLLKTIFIGHRDGLGGRTEEDYITDLRPLEFMIYDVTGTFDITGGLYEISFAGANNGASRFPQFSRVAELVTVDPKGDFKLSTSMSLLADAMTAQSRKNRRCVIEALQKANSDLDPSVLENFREVQYSIQMDDPYNEERYILDGWTEQERDTTTGTGVFKFGPKVTVEQAIRHIMDRCDRVKKDLTEGDENNVKYSWKVHSEITMVGKQTLNPIDNKVSEKDVLAVVYRIRRHAEVTNTTIRNVLNLRSNDNIDNEVTEQKIRENLIEFDYFFSGKNTDIVDFDLKMEMGLAFLQTLSSSNNLGTGVNQIRGVYPENATIIVPTENDKGDPNVSQEEEPRQKTYVRSRTPIFPATNTNNVLIQNISGAKDTTQFSAMLSKHAALESLEATVTIHGNPYMMSQTNRRGSDRQRQGNNTNTEDQLSTRIFNNWDFIPALAKVNIWMPARNDTPSTGASFDRLRFWYDGYYYIYGIDHKFQGGQFTQDLHMLSLPNESFLYESRETDITECGVQEEQGDTTSTASASSEDTEPTGDEAVSVTGQDNPNKQET